LTAAGERKILESTVVCGGSDAPGTRHAEFPRTGNSRRRSGQEGLSARKMSLRVWAAMLLP
jgi:hypothetical protein